MKRLGFFCRSHLVFLFEHTHALAVLPRRGGQVTRVGVQLHQQAMNRFVRHIQRQPAPRVSDRSLVIALCGVQHCQGLKQLCLTVMDALHFQEAPVVELGIVGQVEPGHELPRTQRGGGLKHSQPIRIRRRLAGARQSTRLLDQGFKLEQVHPKSVSLVVAFQQEGIELHLAAIAAETFGPDLHAQSRQQSTQIGQRGRRILVGPQQGGEHLPAVGPTVPGQITQDTESLAPGDGQELTVAFDTRRAQQKDAELHAC